MSGFLVDTNIVSELRRPKRSPAVVQWFASVDPADLYLSVLTLGEIRRGIQFRKPIDQKLADNLERWLNELRIQFRDRILLIDETVAEQWGSFSFREPLPVMDALIAATASVHHLTVVTRNLSDFERTDVPCLNPFDFI